MRQEPIALSLPEGDGWHCDQEESDLPNSLNMMGGKAKASLTFLYQALDSGSLKPSPGQLDQWLLSVNCLETV